MSDARTQAHRIASDLGRCSGGSCHSLTCNAITGEMLAAEQRGLEQAAAYLDRCASECDRIAKVNRSKDFQHLMHQQAVNHRLSAEDIRKLTPGPSNLR